jgi:hypothetical protein
MRSVLLACVAVAASAAPVITELLPRGAQTGRPFTLTFIGRDIGDGARVWSTMPATFTPVVGEKGVQFLVEPRGELRPGVYPVRLETGSGISNILLFSVGTFPELTEQESLPYSEPNRNDTIENAESVQSAPVVVNGTLKGPERDVYRVYGKAGETRVFEVEARRCASAIDPVLRIFDGSGNQLARSDDAAGAGLDPRIDFKFPREGSYYVEVRDARYSTQMQNFYRLKMGAYTYAKGIFPLGGRRGTKATVAYSGTGEQSGIVDLDTNQDIILAGAFPFVVSDSPELLEPAAPVAAPTVINGRIAQPGEIDKFKIKARSGQRLLIEVQARDLGTSRLEAVITAYDSAGKTLDSAGDKPLPEDVFAVQGTSRTSNDPFLNLQVPEGTDEITLAIEDIAGRGGPHFGYRIAVRQQAEDFSLTLATPYVNVPKGGTAFVAVAADRRGYDGPIQLAIENLPKGIRAEGGTIPRETVDPNNQRTMNRRGMLILSAEPDAEMSARELVVIGTGGGLKRTARGPGISEPVSGATAQGVVDRQRPVTAPWLGLGLPAASTKPQPATLHVKQIGFTRKEEGDSFDFEYTWTKPDGLAVPDVLAVDVVGARDIRVVNFKESKTGGTFTVNTTKATEPATYDVVVRGRVGAGMNAEEIYARPVALVITERSENVQTAAAR